MEKHIYPIHLKYVQTTTHRVSGFTFVVVVPFPYPFWSVFRIQNRGSIKYTIERQTNVNKQNYVTVFMLYDVCDIM